jgi:type II secretory pathway pseudopilin PulG
MKRSDDGYTLIALLIMITVGAILIASVAPTWAFLAQRDKEEELIFRGESYIAAIDRYRTRFNKLPAQLKDLLKENHIRKLYGRPDNRWRFRINCL